MTQVVSVIFYTIISASIFNKNIFPEPKPLIVLKVGQMFDPDTNEVFNVAKSLLKRSKPVYIPCPKGHQHTCFAVARQEEKKEKQRDERRRLVEERKKPKMIAQR